jgi:hypothetical protein
METGNTITNRLRDFDIISYNSHNILSTGKIQEFINEMNDTTNAPLSSQERIKVFMTALSQTLSSQGKYSNVGRCASLLRNQLYLMAKVYPVETQSLIKDVYFKDDPFLIDTIKKMKYISAKLFGSSYTAKVWHHLRDIYGDNKRYGVSYLSTGVSLMLGGSLITYFSYDTSKQNNPQVRDVALTATATGASMMTLPFLNAFYLATKDEP